MSESAAVAANAPPERGDGPRGPAPPSDLRERVEDFVRENPALSLVAALAAGYLAGRAVSGLFRRWG